MVPPSFSLLSERRPTEAVCRLLAEYLLDSEYGPFPVDEPSAHRRLVRQPLVQVLKEICVDTDIDLDRRLSCLQEDRTGALVWQMCGVFPLVLGSVRR